MESSKKKRNSVLPIIVSVGIATSMGVVAGSAPEVAYASSNAATSTSSSTSAKYADRSSSYYDDDDPIYIPDENLKKKLIDAARKDRYCNIFSESDITVRNARWCLNNVDLSSSSDTPESEKIHNLEGIQYFKSLQIINLWNNHISDLSPLKNLTNLAILGVDSNQVSDLSPLKGLTNLEKLSFSGNQVSDLTPLKGLTNLEKLYLDGNQVSKLDPLKNLTNLKILWCGSNQVSDLRPLGNLTQLEDLSIKDQKLSINSDTEKTVLSDRILSLPDKYPDKHIFFRIQDEYGKIGRIIIDISVGWQEEFVLSNTPYTGSVKIDFECDLKYNRYTYVSGYRSSKYTGTITLNLNNVPKIEILHGVMKYKADPSLDYQENKLVTAAKDGTKKTYANRINPVIDPAVDGLTKVGNKEIITNSDGAVTVKTYKVNPDDGTLSNPTEQTVKSGEPIASGEPVSEVLPAKMTYIADKTGTLQYGETQKESDPKDGLKVTTPMGKVEGGKWVNADPKVEITPAVNGVTKVGNVKTEKNVINFKTTYVADSTLAYNTKKDKTDGKDGSTTVTTTYEVNPDTGLTAEVEDTKENTVDPTNHVVRVGNVKTENKVIEFEIETVNDDQLDEGKEVTTNGQNGSETVITTYKVDTSTGLTDTVESTKTENRVDPVKQIVRRGTKRKAPAPEPPAPNPNPVNPVPDPSVTPGGTGEPGQGGTGGTETPGTETPGHGGTVEPGQSGSGHEDTNPSGTGSGGSDHQGGSEPGSTGHGNTNPGGSTTEGDTPGSGTQGSDSNPDDNTPGNNVPGGGSNWGNVLPGWPVNPGGVYPGGTNPNVNPGGVYPGVYPWFNPGSTGGSTTGSNGEGTNSQSTDSNNFGNDFNTGGTNYGTGTGAEGDAGAENGGGSQNSPSAQRKNGQTHKTHAKNGTNSNSKPAKTNKAKDNKAPDSKPSGSKTAGSKANGSKKTSAKAGANASKNNAEAKRTAKAKRKAEAKRKLAAKRMAEAKRRAKVRAKAEANNSAISKTNNSASNKANSKANNNANAKVNASANANAKANSNSKSSESANNSSKTAESSKSSNPSVRSNNTSLLGIIIAAVVAAGSAIFIAVKRWRKRN